MLLLATIVSGGLLGWGAARAGLLAIAPPAVAWAAVLTLAAYLRFLYRDRHRVLREIWAGGFQRFHHDSLRVLLWSFFLRACIMGASGAVAYWIAASLG